MRRRKLTKWTLTVLATAVAVLWAGTLRWDLSLGGPRSALRTHWMAMATRGALLVAFSDFADLAPAGWSVSSDRVGVFLGWWPEWWHAPGTA